MAQDLVKSAARALEILEVFAAERKRLSATQLGAALGYPKSSLSVLLRSLVSQGYLSVNGAGGDYFPTLRLARLGDWVPAALLGSEALLPLLQELRDRTGETVTLTVASDLRMRCLHAVIGTHPIALLVEEGVDFPMIGTAVGTMHLATRSDEAVGTVLDRWFRLNPAQSARRADLEQAILTARERGVATAYDAVLPDTGAVAVPIGNAATGETMIIAAAGLSRRIQASEVAIIRELRRATKGRTPRMKS